MKEFAIERRANSVEEAFALAVTALAEIVPAAGEQAVAARLPVLIAAAPLSELLRGFVGDLLMLAERDGFRPRRLERLALVDGLRAAVSGDIDPGRAGAWACRDASLQARDGIWRMRVLIAAAGSAPPDRRGD